MERLQALIKYNLTETDLNKINTLAKWAKEHLALSDAVAASPCPFCDKPVKVTASWEAIGWQEWEDGEIVESGIDELGYYLSGDVKCQNKCFILSFREGDRPRRHQLDEGVLFSKKIPRELWKELITEVA